MSQEKQFSPRLSRLADALTEASRALEAGRLNEADATLRRILNDDPAQPEALHLLALVHLGAGQAAAAVRIVDVLVQAHPNVAAFQATASNAYRRNGEAKKAIEHGRAAVALNSSFADGHYYLGLALAEDGQDDQAIDVFARVRQLAPRSIDATYARAGVLCRQGRLVEAETEYRHLLAISPGHAEALNNLGTLLRELERPAEAAAAFKAALAQRPNYMVALNNLILAHKDLGQLDDAVAAAQQALRFDPGSAKTLARLGAVLIERRDAAGAIAALSKLVAVSPTAEFHEMLGQAHSQAGEVERAAAAFRKAIELNPAMAAAHARYGRALEQLGRFDEALDALEKAIALDPDHAAAYFDLAYAKTFESQDDRHFAAIEAQNNRLSAMPVEAQILLHFAAAKAFDDIGRHDEAFEHLLKANTLKRRTITYDEWSTLDFLRRIEDKVTADLVAVKSGSGEDSKLPIFVVGMPRSGTTLVGRILAAHTRVASAGELNDLTQTVQAARHDGRPARYPECLTQLTAAELRAIGVEYVTRLRRRSPGAERIIDKANGNFLFVGLIYLAMPNAKIVHVKRNAADTCFSCFAQLFDGSWNATYDLGELGRYYRAYDRLMRHCRKVLPESAFLELRYEDLVADFEGEARRLLAYCELPWDARVLDFHTLKAPVQTASMLQVRQPIYRSAIGRARRYRQHLAPLIAELERD